MSLICKIWCFRQCQWGTSCRSRKGLSNAKVKSDSRLTGVEIWPFPFRKGVISYGELARGGWQIQGTRELGEPWAPARPGEPWAQAQLGEPRGGTIWTLHLNNKSKNPYEKSSVREHIYCVMKYPDLQRL